MEFKVFNSVSIKLKVQYEILKSHYLNYVKVNKPLPLALKDKTHVQKSPDFQYSALKIQGKYAEVKTACLPTPNSTVTYDILGAKWDCFIVMIS